MISITKIGASVIAVVLVVGFGALGYGQYKQTQVINGLQQPVVVKTVVVTPTNEPTATPSASVKVYTPATVVRPLTK